ncbi:MAG: hypothetical protein V2B17_08445 [Chloroflexota bacterium]
MTARHEAAFPDVAEIVDRDRAHDVLRADRAAWQRERDDGR